MRRIGEKVVYSTYGIMEIIDVREECVGDVIRKYYVMREPNSTSATQVFVPVDNKKLVSAMRPLLTREEALLLIDSIPTLDVLEWKSDNRIRSEKFRKIVESGNRSEMLALIKTVYENGERRGIDGKKNYLTDEGFMKKAEKLLYSELSEVLGIPSADIPEFIKERINGASASAITE